MGLFTEWSKRLETGDKAAQDYITKYYEKERDVYAKILSEKTQIVKGTVKELAEIYSLELCEVAGFIDGINTSLEAQIDVDALAEDSAVELKIVWETLFRNMLEARAPWLYELEEWDGILSVESREEITHDFKASLQAVSTKVSRNAPCPCGSGKKYKKCCGANED